MKVKKRGNETVRPAPGVAPYVASGSSLRCPSRAPPAHRQAFACAFFNRQYICFFVTRYSFHTVTVELSNGTIRIGGRVAWGQGVRFLLSNLEGVCMVQPCNIKEFIDRVISSPHDELAEKLRGFTAWDFGKVRTILFRDLKM